MYYKVRGNSNLVRDPNTNAILNINSTEYDNYKKIKENKDKEQKKLHQLESDVNQIKSDIDLIKKLLLEIKNES
jgi:hypothetical protein